MTEQTAQQHSTVLLGYEHFPLPMVRADGTIGVLDGRIPLPSRVSSSVANGHAYRNLLVPSHMKAGMDILLEIAKPTGIKSALIVSDPGQGKSFLADYLALIMTGEKSEKFEAAGRSLSEMFFYTTFDDTNDQTLVYKVMQLWREGALEPVAQAKLKDALGEALDTSSLVVDWDKALTDPDRVQKITDAFTEVGTLQRIPQSSSGVGFKTIPGAITRAWQKNTVGLVDELGDVRGETEKQAQLFLQMLIGQVPEARPTSSTGTEYLFSRKDMPPSFFTLFTSNHHGDAASTRQMARSLTSRLQPIYFGKFTKKDWVHRLCQDLTGVPVSTLREAYSATWKSNPSLFVPFLRSVRVDGLTADELALIPDHQLEMLKNPDEVVRACEIVADFIMAWDGLIDEYKSGKSRLSQQIEAELDDKVIKRLMVDPRMISRLIGSALTVRPRVREHTPSSQPLTPANLLEAARTAGDWRFDDPLSTMGSALAAGMVEKVENLTMGLPNVRNYLLGKARDCGIVGGNLTGPSADPISATRDNLSKLSLAQCLNIDRTPSEIIMAQAAPVQGYLADTIAAAVGLDKKALSGSLTRAAVANALERAGSDPRLMLTAETDVSRISNDPQSTGIVAFRVVGRSEINYSQPIAAWQDMGTRREADLSKLDTSVLSLTQLAMALSLPGQGRTQTDRLFPGMGNISAHDLDNSQRMLYGAGDDGVGVTLVGVNDGGSLKPAAIFKSNSDTVMITTSQLDGAIEDDLKRNKVSCFAIIPGNKKALLSAVNRVVKTDNLDTKKCLITALGLLVDTNKLLPIKDQLRFGTSNECDETIYRLLEMTINEGAAANFSIAMRTPWRLTARAASLR